MSRRITRAFTLVELLVVITIIVVLLALLAPAMDKAIYQAELAVCGSKIKAACNGATVYAAASNRYYPPHAFGTASLIKQTPDDLFRPALRTMLAINPTLNDLLAPKAVDLDASPATSVTGSYYLFFGYGYTGDKNMAKMGDRWTYTLGSVTDRFSLLVSDSATGSFVYSNHLNSDSGPSLSAQVAENQVLAPSGAGIVALPTDASYTFSRWLGNIRATPRFDLNYGYEDGSVRRYNTVRVDGLDERMTQVAARANKANGNTTEGLYLPRE